MPTCRCFAALRCAVSMLSRGRAAALQHVVLRCASKVTAASVCFVNVPHMGGAAFAQRVYQTDRRHAAVLCCENRMGWNAYSA